MRTKIVTTRFCQSILPTFIYQFRVRKFIIKTVRPKHYKIMSSTDFEMFDLRLTDDYIRIPTHLFQLCMSVTNCSRDTQSSWYHSMRSTDFSSLLNNLKSIWIIMVDLLGKIRLKSLIRQNFIDLLENHLTWRRPYLFDCTNVNIPTCFFNSCNLVSIRWLMVSREDKQILTSIST